MSECIERLPDQSSHLQRKQYVPEVFLILEQTVTSLGLLIFRTICTLGRPYSNVVNGLVAVGEDCYVIKINKDKNFLLSPEGYVHGPLKRGPNIH